MCGRYFLQWQLHSPVLMKGLRDGDDDDNDTKNDDNYDYDNHDVVTIW